MFRAAYVPLIFNFIDVLPTSVNTYFLMTKHDKPIQFSKPALEDVSLLNPKESDLSVRTVPRVLLKAKYCKKCDAYFSEFCCIRC